MQNRIFLSGSQGGALESDRGAALITVGGAL
jgi:hypothetical protein